MSKRIAFAMTTALTVFVVVTMAALYATLTTTEATYAQTETPQNDAATWPESGAMNLALSEETGLSREELYNQRLEEANVLLTRLQDQVDTLKQRESIYQQRLGEANQELSNSLDPDAVAQGEELYQQQLAEAEELLNQANNQIIQSSDETQQLQQENLLLRNSVEPYQLQDQQYRQQLTQASDLLQQAYDQISQIKSQNDLLLQREQVYQQQITDLNTQLSGQPVATTIDLSYSSNDLKKQQEWEREQLKKQEEREHEHEEEHH